MTGSSLNIRHALKTFRRTGNTRQLMTTSTRDDRVHPRPRPRQMTAGPAGCGPPCLVLRKHRGHGAADNAQIAFKSALSFVPMADAGRANRRSRTVDLAQITWLSSCSRLILHYYLLLRITICYYMGKFEAKRELVYRGRRSIDALREGPAAAVGGLQRTAQMLRGEIWQVDLIRPAAKRGTARRPGGCQQRQGQRCRDTSRPRRGAGCPGYQQHRKGPYSRCCCRQRSGGLAVDSKAQAWQVGSVAAQRLCRADRTRRCAQTPFGAVTRCNIDCRRPTAPAAPNGGPCG